MAKADNMLAILWLLRSRGGMTAAQFADALEISERTVYRYIDSLCASGVPIMAQLGPDGGYHLAAGFRGAPLFFEPTELKAIFQAAQFAREAGYPYSDAMERATAKIGQNLSPSQLGDLTSHISTLRFVSLPRGGPVSEWLEPLELAVANCTTVRMGYQKPEDEAPQVRLVNPYGLIYIAGLWYLLGYCHQRHGLRNFRVDRIRSLDPTDQTFERPANFRVEEYFRDDWLFKQVLSGPFSEVRLTGAPATLAALAEHWYLRHCLIERSSREVILRMDPQGFDSLPEILLPYGTTIAVKQPEELRAAVIQLAATWLRHHDKQADNA